MEVRKIEAKSGWGGMSRDRREGRALDGGLERA
jgi:hypothetical protein